VITVELSVVIAEERLGARLIDNLMVTEDGAEVLSWLELIVVGQSGKTVLVSMDRAGCQ
jgi:hypothetical protein